jgi:hypothetical protein
VEILVIDFENLGQEEIRKCLENTRYISPEVKTIEQADIGEWTDDHPLNKSEKMNQEYERLFPCIVSQ